MEFSNKRYDSEVEIINKSGNFHTDIKLLKKSISFCYRSGLFLEFGVFKGKTIKIISEEMPDKVIHGFDSFEGLPEKWKDNYVKGTFSLRGNVPNLGKNIILHKGWYSETLPKFFNSNSSPISFIHIDCDIYSSAKNVLFECSKCIRNGTVIQFDELFNYAGFEKHEMKAFFEFVDAFNVKYKYIGRATFQASLIIESINNQKKVLTFQKIKKEDKKNTNLISRHKLHSNLILNKNFNKYFAVISYNRPKYLKMLINSIEKYQEKNSVFIFFQDSNICHKFGNETTSRDSIDKCISLIENSEIKNKILIKSSKNYGTAIMYREAYRILFENSKLDFVVFLEDDISFGEFFFNNFEELRKKFESHSDVFGISLLNRTPNKKKPKNQPTPTLEHQWCLGMWRDRYLKAIEYYDKNFYKIFRNICYYKENIDYSNMFKKLFKEIDISKNFVISQDACKEFCLLRKGMYKVCLNSNYIYYNGVNGIHCNRGLYDRARLGDLKPDNYKVEHVLDLNEREVFYIKKRCKNISFNSMGISEGTWDFIVYLIANNSLSGLALDVGYGCGYSNKLLSRYFDTTSLEQEEKYSSDFYLPLVEKEDKYEKYVWYKDSSNWTNKKFDLVFVDGPSGNLGRYGSIPELEKNNCISEKTLILLDDGLREGEKRLGEKWCQRYGYYGRSVEDGRGVIILCKDENYLNSLDFGKNIKIQEILL